MNLETLPIRMPAILIALTIHEYAHGYIAWRRGDDTAMQAGRLTFNPLSHLDVFGTIMLLFGPFGWAKPVPVNAHNLKDPHRDMVWVSLAGPFSNIALALVIGYAYRLLRALGIEGSFSYGLDLFVQFLLMINLGIAFFNLIPVPPLDGSKVVVGLLSPERAMAYARAIRHAPKIFLGLLVAEWGLDIPVFSTLINPLWRPWMAFWQFVIFGGGWI
ncbi:MAG: site-2 protease family protein [Chitinivibrionales bacterium]|nr:site-2 protease family protein [Chitinivibrionales bacterium]MBD3358318.1 site-2 protease family protein [Chitinivibrionales bacterium]